MFRILGLVFWIKIEEFCHFKISTDFYKNKLYLILCTHLYSSTCAAVLVQ